MFCILFQPSPNAFGTNMPKLKKAKLLSSTEASLRWCPGKGGTEKHEHTAKHADKTASQESHSLIMLTFVFRLHYKSFAIYASDKSAFCKRQLSIYNMPSIQKEKSSDPLPQGKAPAHVNTVSAWASQPPYGARSSTGRVHRTLSPPAHAWRWTSLSCWGPECHLQTTEKQFFRR